MPSYFLGVDGGQSSTTVLIGDETGRVAGHARGGPCNHVAAVEARQKFLKTIGDCVVRAREAAGMAAEAEFEAGCLGFSGGPADKEQLVPQLATIRKRLVTHDAMIALAGATAGEPGIITIAGTGSICFGRNAEGRTVRAGGWGYVYGDEGGGFDLTRQALRAALRMEEGWGPQTALRGMLLEAAGASSANELMHRFYGPDFPRPRIAGLSRVVADAAAAGDVVAEDILQTAGQQLAGITAAVRGQIFGKEETALVCPIGGVFRVAAVRERFRSILELDGRARIAEPALGPAAGALLEAYRLAGLKVALTNLPEEKTAL